MVRGEALNRREMLIGLCAALLVGGFISLFASSRPDGLQRVATDKGFLRKGEVRPAVSAPIPDYALQGLKNKKLALSLSGILGTFLVFGVGYTAGVLLSLSKSRDRGSIGSKKCNKPKKQ